MKVEARISREQQALRKGERERKGGRYQRRKWSKHTVHTRRNALELCNECVPVKKKKEKKMPSFTSSKSHAVK